MYAGIKSWIAYDPKQPALNRVKDLLDTAYESPVSDSMPEFSSCGGVIDRDWRILQDSVKTNSNQYTLSIKFYNWEEEYPGMRSGDEIIVEILFEDGSIIDVYTYESCTVFCTIPDE
jgi:hypothetical protein